MVSQELPELWGQRPEEVNSLCWSRDAQQRRYYDLTDCSAHNGFRGQLLAFYPLHPPGQALTVSKHAGIGMPGEINPDTDFPLLERMECSLVEKSQRIVVVSGTGFEKLYGSDSGLEDFHCRYGLNPKFEHFFHGGPLEIVARSEDGGVRAVALRAHPFFVGTLFQPERKALKGTLHPVVKAFFAACVRNAVEARHVG